MGGVTYIATVTAQWCNENSDLIVEVLAEGAVAIGEGAEALGSLLTDGIVIERKITAGHAVANASNATRISASEKDEGESETSEREYKTKKKVKGKQKDDIPERFRGEKPYKGESGKDAAKRILQEYGEYDPNRTGPGTVFNQLKKYFDTHFE